MPSHTRRGRYRKSKTKAKTRCRRGGGIIGSGSYGCVYRPALRCPGNAAVNRSQQISKLVKTKSIAGEIQGIDLLKAADPAQDYLLYPLDETCPFNITAQPDPVSIQASFLHPTEFYNTMPGPMQKIKCPIKGINQNSTVLFNYDGGEKPTNRSYSANDYFSVFEGFTKILDGVNVLHKHKLVHHDIKDLNMVLKLHESGSGFEYRLIDFGFMRRFEQFRSRYADGPSINDNYVLPYIIWPFYIFIFSYKRTELLDLVTTTDPAKKLAFEESLKRKFQRWEQTIKDNIGKIPEGLFYKHDGRPDRKKPVLLSIDNIKANIYNIIATEENYISFAKNVDIFSTGYSLIMLFSHMFSIYSYLHKSALNSVNIYIYFKDKGLQLYDTYRWPDKTITRWIENFIVNVVQPFYNLIGNMYRHENLWMYEDYKSEYKAFLEALHNAIYVPRTNEKQRGFVKYINHVKPPGFSMGTSTPYAATPIPIVPSTGLPMSSGIGLSVALPPPQPPQVQRLFKATGRVAKRQLTPAGSATNQVAKDARVNSGAAVVSGISSTSSSGSFNPPSQSSTPNFP